MAPMFETLGAPLPAQLRIAIGFGGAKLYRSLLTLVDAGLSSAAYTCSRAGKTVRDLRYKPIQGSGSSPAKS